MSLSSLLVQREVATLREVEEALARQVLYGGDLLLNLFEVSRPDEQKLAAVLAELHALDGAPGGMLPRAADRALALVPPDMARRGVFLPVAVDGDRLSVIVAEPLPSALENEISFALGVRLVQRVAPGFRILEAVARDYGQPTDRRVERLLARLSTDEGVDSGGPMSEPLLGPELAVRAPPRAPSMHPSSPPPGPVAVRPKDPRKITEQGFPAVTPEMIAAALRAQSNSQEPPAPANAQAAPSATVPPRTPLPEREAPSRVDPATDADVESAFGAMEPDREALPPPPATMAERRPTPVSPAPVDNPIPRPLPPSPNQIVTPIAFPTPRDQQAPRTEASPLTRSSSRGPAPLFTPAQTRRPTPFLGTQAASPAASPVARGAANAGARVTHAVRPVRPARRRRGPLVLEGARRELDEALDRDAVLDVFFDFTRQYVDYAALFVVLGDLAEGRDAFGDGAPRDKVAGIGVPLELPGMLHVTRNRRTVLQLVPTGGLDAELMADLGRAPGSPIVIVPVVVRGRVVALFVGDSGPGGVEVDSLETISAFALSAGQAFERLIVRRKNARQSVLPPPPPTVAATPAARREPVPIPTTRREGRSIAAPPPGSPRPAQASQPDSIEITLDSAPDPEVAADEDATPIAPSVIGHDDALTPIAPSVAIGGHADQTGKYPAPSSSLASPATTKREGRARDPFEARDPFPSHPVPVDTSDPPSSRTGRRVSVPPHKPPTSADKSARGSGELPSVIVDVDNGILDLVSRFVRGGDPEVESDLLRMGQRAMPAIMASFPGPLAADADRFARLDDAADAIEPPIRASECGPLLHLIAGQRRVAVPFVIAAADDPRRDIRFWATFLLLELPYAEASTTLLARMFDAAPRTRRVARYAARVVAESGPHLFLDYLGRIAADPESEPTMRLLAVETLGELRQPRAVPLLLELLSAPDGELARTAHRALVVLTGHDFDRELRKWGSWWSQNAHVHRVEWLIDALVADDEARAEVAGLELKAITKEYFGFEATLPRRERERAQQRYRDWWVNEGKARFRRD
jgi:hypothetical protein